MYFVTFSDKAARRQSAGTALPNLSQRGRGMGGVGLGRKPINFGLFVNDLKNIFNNLELLVKHDILVCFLSSILDKE